MNAEKIRYHLLAYRREQLWLPVALWALFVILVSMFRGEPKTVEISVAFLGVVLPLIAGILAASALIDDPALELQLATPHRPWRTLLERMGLLFAIVMVAAVTYQGFLAVIGVDHSVFGNLAVRQLVWIVPSLGFMALACIASLGAGQVTVGVLLVGAIWIMQVVLRGEFMASAWARFLFLFTGSLYPDSPDLAANRACLIALAAVFLLASAKLLEKEERYL